MMSATMLPSGLAIMRAAMTGPGILPGIMGAMAGTAGMIPGITGRGMAAGMILGITALGMVAGTIHGSMVGTILTIIIASIIMAAVVADTMPIGMAIRAPSIVTLLQEAATIVVCQLLALGARAA